MAQTPNSRHYAWAKQVDYGTAKAIAAGNFKELILMDQNFLDYDVSTGNDEDWSHGANTITDQWVESHANRVQHTMPAFAQQLGELFYLNLGQYSVVTPGGGTLSRNHTFKPTDPATTRQNPAVSYLENVGGTGGQHNILARGMVGAGFTLKGSGLGPMQADFELAGSGFMLTDSAATWYPTATPTVVRRTGQHKLFNTQIGLVATDGTLGATTYGCRYRSFEFAYKHTMLDEASISPGCATFLTSGDQTSGAIRTAHEFDKQMLDFTFEVDILNQNELVRLQKQYATSLVLTATGGIIEGAIPFKLIWTIPIGKWNVAKPVVSGGIMRTTVSGNALFDFATSKLFDIVLTNDTNTYASGW